MSFLCYFEQLLLISNVCNNLYLLFDCLFDVFLIRLEYNDKYFCNKHEFINECLKFPLTIYNYSIDRVRCVSS